MSERRFESRFLCADLVKVEWLEHVPETVLRNVEAVLEDISPHGACVQIDEPIALGVPILISVQKDESARLAGEVSYCVFRDYGYFVGIRFSDETIWSSGVYLPQHLTNLAALGAHAIE